MQEKGNLSINSENILPIIKKWLYSDSDIFVREMISNAADAITKLKKLVDLGETPQTSENEKFVIHVFLDKENKTIQFIDNGIGMDADEVRQYINEIAFSGANAFMDKYKDKLDKDNEIIGHFGLGFYSVFMVADKVEIDTLSYREGAEAVKWVSDGGVEYEMDVSEKTDRGTCVTLHIGESGADFLDEYKLRGVLKKYCGFMPIEIYFDAIKPETAEDIQPDDETGDVIDMEESDAGDDVAAGDTDIDTADMTDETENDVIDMEDGAETDETGDEDAENDLDLDEDMDLDEDLDLDDHDHDHDENFNDDFDGAGSSGKDEKKPINNVSPLWLKQPNECKDEEYKTFFHEVFMDFNDPLFWIHLNMEYPFRLKGILYFPKLKHELESIEGQVKLYNNQVFIADNIKEVIPEFLLLLKGALDCPDLPLNVSRSFLQNDGYVTKMSAYITRKVADKLNSLFKKEREDFNKYWDDISPFIKYGCIKEKNFYEKIKDSIVFKTINGSHATMGEYLEAAKEKHENTIFYVSDEKQQAQYIKLFKDFEMDAVVLDTNLDNPFMSYLESYDRNIKFNRIDSNLSESLKQKPRGDEKKEDGAESADEKAADETLVKLFKDTLKNDKLKIQTESLKSESVSAMILLSEQSRRMQEMSKMFGQETPGWVQNEETLVLNKNNPLIKALVKLQDDDDRKDDAGLICEHVYDLALMGHKPLEVDAMNKFLERSGKILEKIATLC